MAIKLTKREADIYPYLFTNNTVKDLSIIFNMGRVTISHHISRICIKKGAASRLDLMANEILRLRSGLNEYEM